MKIYTRRGDQGETDLFGGGRVAKDHLRVDAYGAVDELNAAIGLAAVTTEHGELVRLAERIQAALFSLGAFLATPDPERRAKGGIPELGPEDVEELETRIDDYEGELPALRAFVLPGGTRAAAHWHLARTVCRRAERRAVALAHAEPLDEAPVRYLNRLSDLLFVLARLENARAGVPDVTWSGRG